MPTANNRRITYKPYPSWDGYLDQMRSDGLAEWLRVPWSLAWKTTYSDTKASLAAVADIAGASQTMTFTKVRDTSRMVFSALASSYVSAAGVIINLYISLSASNYTSADSPIALFYFNAGATHNSYGGHINWDNLPAGIYTMKLRWAGTGGAGNMQCDANDWFTILATETNVSPD